MATDKRLDQVSQLTDFDYALLVKGDQVGKMTKQQVAEAIGNLLYGATTKENLASVVDEQMREGSMYPYMFRGFCGDANNANNSGCYRLNAGSTNVPVQYGVLVVNKTSDYIFQLVCSAGTTSKLYIRLYADSAWNEWQEK